VKFKDLTFVSYDSGIPGYVTSEWVDDKLHSLSTSDVSVSLVTHPKSVLKTKSNLIVLKPYSFGWRDFSGEKKGRAKRFSLGFVALWIFAGTLGRAFDFAFEKLAGAYSWGKWSWVLLAFPVALTATVRSKSKVIFTTGGPSSAHFVGLLVKILVPKSLLYVELQDPFIGTEMGLSARSKKVMEFLEKVLVKNATKVVFVTEVAAERARKRFVEPELKNKIEAIYPGSWNFGISPKVRTESDPVSVTFLHVGSLYTSRNLDLLFDAIDDLKGSSFELADEIQIINQGDLSVLNADEYRFRSEFREWPVVGRELALKKASQADFLLLIQHSDSRSEETIPYKTYDYLNLGVPIFGLTNNTELDKLIENSGGFVGSSKSIEKTVQALKAALVAQKNGFNRKFPPNKLDINTQFSRVFD
jgi:glycosyltransferase involved in cell wall biosynthesis